MSFILSALVAVHAGLAITSVSGHVTGPDGAAIGQAQVFLEPGLGGAIVDAVADGSGYFEFHDIAPGPAGVFAIAPGFGFEGQHLTIAVADAIAPIRIVLHPATRISGVVRNHKGEPVSGARITRIGVKRNHKVGVPLAKLKLYGYAEPESDGEGRFALENVPEGTVIDMKVGHASYAQEGVGDVPAGAADVGITLHPGVLLEGTVVTRAANEPVAQVSVLVQSAQPPHDTALARSGLQGRFSLRLKPGVYMYQATGAGLRSPGWERMAITGENPVERLRVAVAGAGHIRGTVHDAMTGDPIRDVRLTLTTNGTPAAVTRTGPGGDFLFTAGEGENIVRLEMAPGYFPPESQDIKVSILENAAVELPGMWLKPLPEYAVTVVDDGGAPVPGALVTLLRPAQFGWYVADGEGKVALRVHNFPEAGTVLGRAEHPHRPMGALFSLEKQQEVPGTVQLYPLASLSGRVVNNRGRGVGGATVGAFFPGESASDAILLWQTASDAEGTFRWDAVVPGVPQRCAARLGPEAHGESATFNLPPGGSETIGDIAVSGASSGAVLLGNRLAWYSDDIQCGTLPDEAECNSRPVLLLYASAANADAVAESAGRVLAQLGPGDLIAVVVADGPVICSGSTAVPIIRGKAQSAATTVLLDSAGTVILESTGLPPAALLRGMN